MNYSRRLMLMMVIGFTLFIPLQVMASAPLTCTVTPATVQVNANFQVQAAGGTGPYWITISDSTMVLYTPSKLDKSGRASGLWAMTATKTGQCIFTVKDATGATVKATLNVVTPTAAPVVPPVSATLSNSSPYVDEEITVTIAGGIAPYKITSGDASIVLTPISQTQWRVKPTLPGNFTLTVQDNNACRTCNISLVAKERIPELSAFFTGGKSNIYTQWPDRSQEQVMYSEKLSIQVMGGKGPWAVTGNPQLLSITGPLGNVAKAPYFQLMWTGTPFTSTEVIVQDSRGNIKKLTVTSPSQLLLDYWPKTRTIKKGETFLVMVKGGAAPFSISWDQGAALAPYLKVMTNSNESVLQTWGISGLSPGSYRFYITDETSKITKFMAVIGLTVTP